VSYAHLVQEWEELLARRPTFHDALRAYGEILAAWSRWASPAVTPLDWTAEECRERWERGVPLLAEAVPALDADALEPLLAPVLDLLAMVGVEEAALQRFARAWDQGEVTPSALLPGKGGAGAPLGPAEWAFLGYSGLRPALDAYFAQCRAHLTENVWQRGVCPFCGAAPGFTDILENGGRRLACHFCGGGWMFARLRCPSCDIADAKQFVKFQGEDKEEGYLISACRACQSYLKELDRRVRWNGGAALAEDWGSPHLDVFAHRSGYWRAVPTLIELEQVTRSRS
jgi:hypothetical protein